MLCVYTWYIFTPMKKDESTTLIIRIPKMEKKRIVKYAKYNDTTISQIIRKHFKTLK